MLICWKPTPQLKKNRTKQKQLKTKNKNMNILNFKLKKHQNNVWKIWNLINREIKKMLTEQSKPQIKRRKIPKKKQT